MALLKFNILYMVISRRAGASADWLFPSFCPNMSMRASCLYGGDNALVNDDHVEMESGVECNAW